MTRYTKLGGRRPAHLASSAEQAQRYASASPEAEAAPKAPSAAATPAKDNGASSSAPAAAAPTQASLKRKADDVEDSAPAAATQPAEPPTASALLKRAKLLRLKAKKAKDPAKRAALEQQAREKEKQASVANGEAGKKGEKRRKEEEVKEGNPWKRMEAERRAKAEPKREARREARAAERNATTRCFACRGLGHAARDCPSALNAESTVLGADEVARATADVPRGKETVGICFRCGSTEHILAKCRRAPPKVGSELPFATCFICAAKGHLASQCPSNAGRGVYPRGGSCKLCSSVEHLARDCPLSLRAQPSGAAELGIAAMTGAQELGEGERKSGADEDDFHTLARRRVELARGEKKKGPAQAPAAGGKGKKVVSF